jgi:vacuolar-type H+-ATPase subunit H
MQEIVNQVLEVEEKAKKIIQQAHEQAIAIKAEVESELSEKVKNSRLQAQQLIRDEIAKAKKETQREYLEAIDRVEKENNDFLAQHNRELQAVVKKITTLLIIPEHKRK